MKDKSHRQTGYSFAGSTYSVLGSSLNPVGFRRFNIIITWGTLKITLIHRPHRSPTKSESQGLGPSLLACFSKFSQEIPKDRVDNHWVEAWIMRDKDTG